MNQMITSKQIVEICLANVKFDSSKFKNSIIEVAEQEFIRPFLGDAYYATIKAGYIAENLSALNKTLVDDYLAPALCWLALYKALPFIMMDISNAGIMINNSEFANSGTDKQRADLMQSVLDSGEALLEKARLFLKDNPTDYPDYLSSTDIDASTSIVGGIIFDSDSEEESSQDL